MALVAAAVIVFFVIRIFSSSPLRQFPTEAGATTTADNFQSSTNDQLSEDLLITDPHSLTQVETYYQRTLHQNGWTTDTRDTSQASSGDTWTLGRTGSSSQRGSITFTTIGASTHIAVVFYY